MVLISMESIQSIVIKHVVSVCNICVFIIT